MYSGLQLRRGSGKLLGTHQKIDKIARRRIQAFIPVGVEFPTAREILKFEGLRGPDGAKRKTPGTGEERHFIDPTNKNDKEILGIIKKHEVNLISALKLKNKKMAAKEASWLAHAIVDGLTPAHHFPLDEHYETMGIDMREEKMMFIKVWKTGKSMRDKLKASWKIFGKKGVMMNHMMFEYSIAYATRNLTYKNIRLTVDDCLRMRKSNGISSFYLDLVQEIYELGLYDDFCKNGWSREFFSQVRQNLLPTMIHAVEMEWYYCIWKAQNE